MEDIPLQKSLAIDAMSASELAPLFWRPVRLGVVSAWWEHVPFAQWFVCAVRPRVIVELGTHNGVSYSAFCEAVAREGLDTQCTAVDTWLGDEHAGSYGESVYSEFKTFHDARYGAFSSLIRSTFDEAVDYFPDGSIDLLHIDGLHSYEAVRHDFECWSPKLSSRAVVLFHDINVRSSDFGVWKLWDELQGRFPSFTFVHGHGLGVLAVGEAVPAAARRLCSISDVACVNAIRERFALIGERWNMEYRDSMRVAEVARQGLVIKDLNAQLQGRIEHSAQLEQAVEEVKSSHLAQDQVVQTQHAQLAELRAQVAELEQARASLHDAIQAHIDRGDALAARNDELTTWSGDLLKSNEMLRAELVDVRRAPERGDMNQLRKELAAQQSAHEGLRSEISELKGRFAKEVKG
ncbi:methyltransferase family protein [Paraburkholderia sp. BL8N3]|nr:class I SAM-dependent methyltransferase [Paraburkholderia sp. BL8N3]TCK42743.1 methyltransferase family protein [Paraburkholderia sp. BL8N3]